MGMWVPLSGYALMQTWASKLEEISYKSWGKCFISAVWTFKKKSMFFVLFLYITINLSAAVQLYNCGVDFIILLLSDRNKWTRFYHI